MLPTVCDTESTLLAVRLVSDVLYSHHVCFAQSCHSIILYRMILSVLDPKKCEYLKDYSLDFEHAYMTTYLAS